MTTRDTRPAVPRYLAVVRRGETRVYRLLKEYLEARGLAVVVWDRRVDERRFGGRGAVGAERRHAERRRPAGDRAGRTLGFFIARPEAVRPAGGERPRADAGR